MTFVAADIAPFPAFPFIIGTAVGSVFTFDGAADSVSLIFQIPKTGTIDKIHYRIATRASPVMTRRIELRTVTAGLPNAAGTLYGASTTITVDATTDLANKNMTAAVAATATAGESAAIVFDLSAFTSGSFTQQENKSMWLSSAGIARYLGFPYGVQNTAASNSLVSDPISCVALEYSGGIFVPINPGIGFVGPGGALTTVTSTGAIRRAGNAFTPATPRRAMGVYVLADIDGGTTLTLRRASDDVVLATATPDKDMRGSTSNALQYFQFDGGAKVTLAAGTGYYITLNGTDATGGIVYGQNGGVSQAMLGTMPGGTNCYGVTHNGTSYTNLTAADTVTRFTIGLMTDQEDNGGGGGAILSRANY